MPINADQNPGIDSKYLSMSIDHGSAMISIDQHWDQCRNFDPGSPDDILVKDQFFSDRNPPNENIAIGYVGYFYIKIKPLTQ